MTGIKPAYAQDGIVLSRAFCGSTDATVEDGQSRNPSRSWITHRFTAPLGARGIYQVFFSVLHHDLIAEGDPPFYKVVDTAWRILVIDLVFIPLGLLE